MNRALRFLFLVVVMVAFALQAAVANEPVHIMALGDSITEGSTRFECYRYPLWEKLMAAGYRFKFVGSRQTDSRGDKLNHEGYGGKDTQFLDQQITDLYRKNPADIVLIHSGHNHAAEEQPVPGILAATESIIGKLRAANPEVKVLLAQAIPSGKLPKYSYIPELNRALARLAQRLNRPERPVILIDQATGFDWRTDTIDDHVHPNARGAEKMATKWLTALQQVMGPPPLSAKPEIVSFKKTAQGELNLHIFKPAERRPAEPSPAIVFFFGGGWKLGTPIQFYTECAHLAERGMVAISADYRIATVHGTTPFESVADGKSAIRWVRTHAKELGVDPHRIVASGASAGGQLAAAAGILSGFDEPDEDKSISSRPDALVLLYPVIDNGTNGYGPPEMKARYREISPLHNITSNAPPAIFMVGTKDKLVPVATAKDFQARMREAGVRCDLSLYEGAGHPIWNYRFGQNEDARRFLREAELFLESLGYLRLRPNDSTVQRFNGSTVRPSK